MICWCKGKIGIPCAAAAVHFEYKTTGHVTSKWRAEGCFHRVDMWQTTAADTAQTAETDRQTQTQTDTETDRQRQTERQTDTQRQRHTYTNIQREVVHML